MVKYLEIGKVNLKHNMPFHILITVVILALSPLVLGIRNLDAGQTAQVFDYYVVMIGIILLPPIFLPEQNENLRDLIKSKHTSQTAIYSIRSLQAIIVLMLLLLAYTALLKYGNCDFDAATYYFATLSGILFLGSLGVAAYSFSDNMVIGYMIPFIYYMINYGGGQRYFKHFYLFSLMKGSYTEKIYLAAAGLLLLTVGILYRSLRRS